MLSLDTVMFNGMAAVAMAAWTPHSTPATVRAVGGPAAGAITLPQLALVAARRTEIHKGIQAELVQLLAAAVALAAI
jgi:hypothetical protein